MNVLIVLEKLELGAIWRRALERQGANVSLVASEVEAIELLARQKFDVIVLDVVLDKGSAFAVSDYANYKHPDARVVFVTNTSFFSDGSIFQHCSNACAFVPMATPPEDLAAMVEHYADVT